MNFITDFLLIRHGGKSPDMVTIDVSAGLAQNGTVAWASNPPSASVALSILHERIEKLRENGNTVFFIGVRWMDILPDPFRPVFFMVGASKIRLDDETTILFSEYLKERRYNFETDQNGIVTSIEGRGPHHHEP